MATTVAVIVAAGRGARALGSDGLPKQYRSIGGRPVLCHSLDVLSSHADIDAVEVVVNPDDRPHYEAAARPFAARLMPAVDGGTSRQESVRRGLEALKPHSPERVLIHDAARPFLTGDLVSRLIGALDEQPAAIAAEPLADTLKRSSSDGTVVETVNREGLWRAQTPQAFRFTPILEAHQRAAKLGMSGFTDDAGLAEWAGMSVKLVASASMNMKLTTPDDLALADRLLSPAMLEPRTGSGFDVHALVPGDHVWLCGVQVPHTHRLEGHSDADVGLHALTDAILGAIGQGDIGAHFPPSDPTWRGAISHLPC